MENILHAFSLDKTELQAEGDRSPKSPFLGATSAKSKKDGEQDCSPFGQSLVEIDFHSPTSESSATHYSSFTPPQQPNSSNKRTTTTKTTTIKPQQNNKSTTATTTKPTTKTHTHNNQAPTMKQQQIHTTTVIKNRPNQKMRTKQQEHKDN